MDQGNWVAIDKRIVHSLPKIADREFSVVEAMVSLSVDYDNKNKVTLRGLASLWKWNHKTVKRWLSEIGVKINYPGDPRLGGFIEFEEGTLKERKGNGKGALRMIKNREIVFKKERKRNTKGTLKEPTIYPDTKPDPKKKNTYSNEFEECWKVTPKRNGQKQGKFSASELFEKLSIEDKRKVYIGLGNYSVYLKTATHESMDLERFIRKRFFDDYQKKSKATGKEAADKEFEETEKLLGR